MWEAYDLRRGEEKKEKGKGAIYLHVQIQCYYYCKFIK